MIERNKQEFAKLRKIGYSEEAIRKIAKVSKEELQSILNGD
jgi:hypothetical protein